MKIKRLQPSVEIITVKHLAELYINGFFVAYLTPPTISRQAQDEIAQYGLKGKIFRGSLK